MAPGTSRKGLPTKKLIVSRLTSKGKLSTYSQGYHLNPFQKTTSSDRSSRFGSTTSSARADSIVSNLKSNVAKLKKQSLSNIVSSHNGQSLGKHTTNAILSKIRSEKDVKLLANEHFAKSFSNISSVNNNTRAHMVNENSKILNNIPPTEASYTELLNQFISNKNKIDDVSFSNMLTSFSDHKLLESVMGGSNKSESYDKDELLHDQYAKHNNPLNYIANHYESDTDNLKSNIIGLYNRGNDLEHLNNNIILTENEKNLYNIVIDNNNDLMVNNDIQLHNNIFIPVDTDIAVMIFKSKSPISVSIYNSILYNMSSSINIKPTNLQFIKQLKVENESRFTVADSGFYLDSSTLDVYLSIDLKTINNGDYDFVSVAKEFSGNSIHDIYNTIIKKSKNLVSLSDMKTKTEKVIHRYATTIDTNDNYLITI